MFLEILLATRSTLILPIPHMRTLLPLVATLMMRLESLIDFIKKRHVHSRKTSPDTSSFGVTTRTAFFSYRQSPILPTKSKFAPCGNDAGHRMEYGFWKRIRVHHRQS